jgi:AcrR family transcriptional regulator
MPIADSVSDEMQIEPGLRSRKKAKRRDEIIAAARTLFAQQGIDATTMADIAAAAGISAPTVFNYFGSKDGILIALIGEGTSEARESDRHLHWKVGADLGTLTVGLFLRVSRRTLEIADKRVWRYAEAAAIRHPETELASQYKAVSRALINVVAEFFDMLDIRTRSGEQASPSFLAQMFHDVWFQAYIDMITSEQQTLVEHEEIIRMRILPLVKLLFDDASINTPRRKGPSS